MYPDSNYKRNRKLLLLLLIITYIWYEYILYIYTTSPFRYRRTCLRGCMYCCFSLLFFICRRKFMCFHSLTHTHTHPQRLIFLLTIFILAADRLESRGQSKVLSLITTTLWHAYTMLSLMESQPENRRPQRPASASHLSKLPNVWIKLQSRLYIFHCRNIRLHRIFIPPNHPDQADIFATARSSTRFTCRDCFRHLLMPTLPESRGSVSSLSARTSF